MRQTLGLVLFRKGSVRAPEHACLVLDEPGKSRDQRTAYVELAEGGSCSYVGWDELAPQGGWHRVGLLVQVVILWILLAPYLAFDRRRASVALIVHDHVRLCLLDRVLLRSPVDRIIWFGAYEKGSALLTWWFIRHRRLKVTIVPSMNPVRIHYRHVVTDRFALTVPFQREEVERELAPGWVLGELVDWPAPGHERLMAVAGRMPERRVIGFLSSGLWLRSETGRSQHELDSIGTEDAAMRACVRYAKARMGTTARVFLHPFERSRPERLARAMEHYLELGFAPEQVITDRGAVAHPEMMDVAVAVHSSALFERLYAGYKGVFCQPGMAPGYFLDGPIARVVVHDEPALVDLLDRTLSIPEDLFFGHFGLQAYRGSTRLHRVDNCG